MRRALTPSFSAISACLSSAVTSPKPFFKAKAMKRASQTVSLCSTAILRASATYGLQLEEGLF